MKPIIPLPKLEFEQRYDVPEGPVVPATCTVDWTSEVVGESALSWWFVRVWAAPPLRAERTYRIKALDDNMAAREGLRAFEREYAAGLIHM